MPVWCPFYRIHISSIEKIQRKYCKLVYFKLHGVYPVQGYPHNQLLDELGIISLEVRRIFTCIIFLYKLVNGYIDSSRLLDIISFHVPRINARNAPTFACNFARTNSHFNSPIYNMCRLYNNIQHSIDTFTINYKSFKKSCKNILFETRIF